MRHKVPPQNLRLIQKVVPENVWLIHFVVPLSVGFDSKPEDFGARTLEWALLRVVLLMQFPG